MAMLVLMHEGLTIKEIPLEKAEIRIGRKIGSDIFLEDKLASQQHAKIEVLPDPDTKGRITFYIEDLQSTNHTFVNGEKISRKALAHEDIIRIGKHVFKFIEEGAMEGDRTTKLHKSWIPGVFYTKE